MRDGRIRGRSRRRAEKKQSLVFPFLRICLALTVSALAVFGAVTAFSYNLEWKRNKTEQEMVRPVETETMAPWIETESAAQ
ncbi:MAG TPA: hypothetical protein H9740_01685 [Candidatus Hungatella pullicola]|nr:hypothetical protein [Candidatus Hungatella pullicola]